MNPTVARILPVAVVVAFYLARMAEVFAKREVVPGKRHESVTFAVFMLCGVLTVFGGIAEFQLRSLTLWWPTFVTGIVLSIVSFALRRAAIHALGRFWSLHVEMRENHEFVTTGPFAFMRHPVYLSMILELAGVGLVLNASFTVAAVFAIFIPTLIARIRIEERALVEKFGNAYREYMRTTLAILPWQVKNR